MRKSAVVFVYALALVLAVLSAIADTGKTVAPAAPGDIRLSLLAHSSCKSALAESTSSKPLGQQPCFSFCLGAWRQCNLMCLGTNGPETCIANSDCTLYVCKCPGLGGGFNGN